MFSYFSHLNVKGSDLRPLASGIQFLCQTYMSHFVVSWLHFWIYNIMPIAIKVFPSHTTCTCPKVHLSATLWLDMYPTVGGATCMYFNQTPDMFKQKVKQLRVKHLYKSNRSCRVWETVRGQTWRMGATKWLVICVLLGICLQVK